MTNIALKSAYQRLTDVQREFVDRLITAAEIDSDIRNRKIAEMAAEAVNNAKGRDLELLRSPIVQSAICERVDRIQQSRELNIDRTLQELRVMAYSNILDYMEIQGDGRPRFDLGNCTREQMSAIKKIKLREDKYGTQTFEFELYDKVASLDKLMKYQGLLNDEHWRETNSNNSRIPAITQDMSDEQASDAYSQLING
jgi:hypothetical protein